MSISLIDPNVTIQALIALIGNRTPDFQAITEDDIEHWGSIVNQALGLECYGCFIGHCKLQTACIHGRCKLEVVGDNSPVNEFLDIVAVLYKSGAPIYIKSPERYLSMLDSVD